MWCAGGGRVRRRGVHAGQDRPTRLCAVSPARVAAGFATGRVVVFSDCAVPLVAFPVAQYAISCLSYERLGDGCGPPCGGERDGTYLVVGTYTESFLVPMGEALAAEAPLSAGREPLRDSPVPRGSKPLKSAHDDYVTDAVVVNSFVASAVTSVYDMFFVLGRRGRGGGGGGSGGGSSGGGAPAGAAAGAALASRGMWIVTASNDGTAVAFDLRQGVQRHVFRSAGLADYRLPVLYFVYLSGQLLSFPLSDQLPWSDAIAPAQFVLSAEFFQLRITFTLTWFLLQFTVTAAYVTAVVVIVAFRERIFGALNERSFESRMWGHTAHVLIALVETAVNGAFLPCVRVFLECLGCTALADGTRVWTKYAVETGGDPSAVRAQLTEYACLGSVHAPVFFVALALLLAQAVLAFRLALVRGAVKHVTRFWDPRADGGVGVTLDCAMGILSRRRESFIVDVIVLACQLLLASVAAFGTPGACAAVYVGGDMHFPRGRAHYTHACPRARRYAVVSVVLLAAIVAQPPFVDPRLNDLITCTRVVFGWTSLCSVVTAVVNDRAVVWPAVLFYVGFVALAVAAVFFLRWRRRGRGGTTTLATEGCAIDAPAPAALDCAPRPVAAAAPVDAAAALEVIGDMHMSNGAPEPATAADGGSGSECDESMPSVPFRRRRGSAAERERSA